MTDLVFVNANCSKRVIAAYRKPKNFSAQIGERVKFPSDPDAEWEIVEFYDEGDETVVRIKFMGVKDDKHPTWDAG